MRNSAEISAKLLFKLVKRAFNNQTTQTLFTSFHIYTLATASFAVVSF